MKIKHVTIIVVINLLLFMTGCGLFSSRDDFEGLRFCEYLNEEGPVFQEKIKASGDHGIQRPINITDTFEPGPFYAHLEKPDGFNTNKLILEVYNIEGEDKYLYHEESIEIDPRHERLYRTIHIPDRGEYIIRFNDSDGNVIEEGNVTIR